MSPSEPIRPPAAGDDPLATVPLDALVLARAVGIVAVVANHALLLPRSIGPGGLNILLLVAGTSMARMAFHSTSRASARLFGALVVRLAVPALALAALSALLLRQFDPTELLLFSNWLRPDRVALFPVWYVQVFAQIALALALVFVAFGMTERIATHPVAVTGAWFAVSLAVAYVSRRWWDTEPLAHHLPHLFLWNLVAGWVYWAVAVQRDPSMVDRALLTVALAAGAALSFLAVDDPFGRSRMLWFTAAIVVLVWRPVLRVPWLIRHVTLLLSHSALHLFLLHYYVFSVVTDVEGLLGTGDTYPGATLVRTVLGVVLPVLMWASVTAALRAARTAPPATQPEVRPAA